MFPTEGRDRAQFSPLVISRKILSYNQIICETAKAPHNSSGRSGSILLEFYVCNAQYLDPENAWGIDYLVFHPCFFRLSSTCKPSGHVLLKSSFMKEEFEILSYMLAGNVTSQNTRIQKRKKCFSKGCGSTYKLVFQPSLLLFCSSLYVWFLFLRETEMATYVSHARSSRTRYTWLYCLQEKVSALKGQDAATSTVEMCN